MVPFLAGEAVNLDLSTLFSTSFNQILADLVNILTAVLPIGMSIFGALFAIRKGKAIFSSVTK